MSTPDDSSARLSLPARILHFFSADAWPARPEGGPLLRLLILIPRTLFLALNGFIIRNGPLRASALTFYTLLSLVPLAAMALGIAKGFGFERLLEEKLMEQFSAQQEVVGQVIVFARNMLDNTQGGLIAGIGVIVLFWSVIKVLGNIEECFNQVWGVSDRSFLRKLSDYMTLMIAAPILLITSGSATVFIATRVSALSSRAGFENVTSPVIALGLAFAPYVLLWILFALLYMIMPNTRIRAGHAFLAAIPAGSAYQLLQAGYVKFQISMTSYNAIYGSFAALPLFLLWLNISWYIVLFGAEIVHALEHVREPEHPAAGEKELSAAEMRRHAVLLCTHVVRRFHLALKAQRPDEIARELGMSSRLANLLADRLVRAGMLVRVNSGNGSDSALQPAMDARNLTLVRVLEALDNEGESRVHTQTPPSLEPVATQLEALRAEMEKSSANRPLLDLVTPKQPV